jgi:superfamily II DNA or RNA helicase
LLSYLPYARYWCPSLRSWVRVLEERTLFGKQVARVMLEGSNSVHTVPLDILQPEHAFDLASALSTVAGARIWSALGSDLFLAPLVSQVLPLPHQFRVLRKAMSGYPVRMMLADEVGMGKTIEAGLLLKELKLRGMVERILVLAPKSLLLQWIVEMDTLFAEPFDLVLPGDWSADVGLRGENAWKRHSQIVTSVDSVKPKEAQRGWSPEKIARYNVERFHDLIGAGWDLVIIDESHKVAGAGDDVSRYELAKELARACPHLLLLTATPHSGKSDAFRRLLSLLDPGTFTAGVPLTRELVETVVIRTEKRTATDADGNPLFAPRSTRLLKVPFGPRHVLQQQLYEEVSQYVVDGYNRAVRQGDKGSRLLLILIQRLVSSSTCAIRHFLVQRLEALADDDANVRASANEHLPDDDDDLDDILQGALFTVPIDSRERADVECLLSLALRVENAGPDARAETLYEQMLEIALDDNDPTTKFLIFTEFRATQEMLSEFLAQRGYSTAILNGTMDIAERKAALECFRGDAQTLISTDAGGEGLNMQFAHVVFNYDLPWNPMRVEQRIGRVDRIGQKRAVRATNLVLENSVEARLYEIWQEKLATILTEFGVDKTGDVLDSTAAGAEFERLAHTALLNPDYLSDELDRVVLDLRKAASESMHARTLYTGHVEETDHLPNVPLRAWIDTMLGVETSGVSQGDVLQADSDVSGRVIALTSCFAEGKPVAHLCVKGLGFPLNGWFSLWKVGIADGMWRQQNVFALYLTDEGKSFAKSALRLWDELATRHAAIEVIGETQEYDFPALQRCAEAESAVLYDSVVRKTQARARHRLNALEMSYLARRSALSRIGLETVREARRRELEAEYRTRKAEMDMATQALPELNCLFLARVSAQ